MRKLLFIALLLWMLPLLFMGTVLFAVPQRRQRGASSGTTYKVLQARLNLHFLGLRPDPATEALARHLPATRAAPVLWMFRAFAWAMKVTGDPFGLAGYPPEQPMKMGGLAMGRSWFIDRALRQLAPELEQVVWLGAGWDTRAWGLPELQDLRCFEVDQPATQAVKEQAVREAGLVHPRLSFVPCTFGEQSWLEALHAAGFDPTLPTFFLWEGVSMYLPEDVVEQTLHDIASCAPGTRVAFDHLGKGWLEGTDEGRAAARAVAAFYDEPFVYSLPMGDERAVRSLCERCGLTLEDTFVSAPGDPDAVFGVVLARVPA